MYIYIYIYSINRINSYSIISSGEDTKKQETHLVCFHFAKLAFSAGQHCTCHGWDCPVKITGPACHTYTLAHSSHVLDGTGRESVQLHKSRNKSLLSSRVFPSFPFFRQSFLCFYDLLRNPWSPMTDPYCSSSKKHVHDHFQPLSVLTEAWRLLHKSVQSSGHGCTIVIYSIANPTKLNKAAKKKLHKLPDLPLFKLHVSTQRHFHRISVRGACFYPWWESSWSRQQCPSRGQPYPQPPQLEWSGWTNAGNNEPVFIQSNLWRWGGKMY